MQRRSLQRIGKTLRRSHRPIVRWLSGALLAWLLLLGVGVPLAAAQSKQGPNTAPANTTSAEVATVDQAATPAAPSRAIIDPALSAGITQAKRNTGPRSGTPPSALPNKPGTVLHRAQHARGSDLRL
jgi:hypothetical protein